MILQRAYRFSLPAFYFNHSQISLYYSVAGDIKEKTQNTSHLYPEDRFTDLFSNKSSTYLISIIISLSFPGPGEGVGGGVQLTNLSSLEGELMSFQLISDVGGWYWCQKGITRHVETHRVTPKALSLLLCSCFLKLKAGWEGGNAGEGEKSGKSRGRVTYKLFKCFPKNQRNFVPLRLYNTIVEGCEVFYQLTCITNNRLIERAKYLCQLLNIKTNMQSKLP